MVTITATDSDGAVSTISFNLTVDNVAPTIATDNANVSATEGSLASNSGTFADVGADVFLLMCGRRARHSEVRLLLEYNALSRAFRV